MRSPFIRAALAAVALLSPATAVAANDGPGDRTVVPGLMGYNALPTVPNADPVVGDELVAELSFAAQLSDLRDARDAAATPYFRLVVPFRGFAALEADAVPVELWRVGPVTRDRLGGTLDRGTARGDVRFGARFTLLGERGRWPALGLRFLTKTTTGKAFDQRRFTNAPAYLLDLLLGKDLPFGAGPFERVRVLAKVGFTAWQQGSDWQDDAIDAGVTFQLHSARLPRLELEWRSYWGYEHHDRPSLVGLTVAQRLPLHAELLAVLNRGINGDEPPWEARLGIAFRIPLGDGARRAASPGAPSGAAPE